MVAPDYRRTLRYRLEAMVSTSACTRNFVDISRARIFFSIGAQNCRLHPARLSRGSDPGRLFLCNLFAKISDPALAGCGARFRARHWTELKTLSQDQQGSRRRKLEAICASCGKHD